MPSNFPNEPQNHQESFVYEVSGLRFFSFRLAIILSFVFVSLYSQKKQFVLIDSEMEKVFIRKDSLSAVQFLDSLATNNYYFTKITKVSKENDITKIIFDKGKNYNQAQVKLSEELSEKLKAPSEFFTKNLDSLKNSINEKYLDEGYTFNRVKTKLLGMKNDIPQVEISVDANRKRTIDGFVLKGYDKVPKQFVRNLEKEYKGKTYERNNMEKISKSLQNHSFVALERAPQTLFTKDSTHIYLFLQKKKSNTFDGIVGFGNNDSEKFSFNGTLNIAFKNIFNGFEQVSLYWQRSADKGQTFDLSVKVPYLFKTNVGLDVPVNIYRQDSTYATVKIRPGLFYHLTARQKIGTRGNFEISSVIDSTYTSVRDFSRNGFGMWYEFEKPSENRLFLYDSKISVEVDFLKTHYDDDGSRASLIRYYLFAEKNFHIRGNHYLNLKGESAMLNAKNDLSENELFLFGGWNSLRGFNENSLIASFYAYGGAEYRYLVNQQAFFDVFAQYGQLSNKTMSSNPKFYSFGVGFNFILPIGLMSFQVSNGSQFGEAFNFKETKIHWGILSRF